MDLNKHIWEGWTVQDFVDELSSSLAMKQAATNMFGESEGIKTKEELKEWCIDNQPYYKKHIPELVSYFAKQYNLK